MKKKLFLFGTCFFLLSSLVIFLTYRNIQLSEITKKKEKEVKRLLKELKEQKEKSSTNQEEKKDENKDNQENNQKEAEEDLPWVFTWMGAMTDLIGSATIHFIFFEKCYSKLKEKIKKIESCNALFLSIFFAFFLYIVVFPLIFAIQKYKNKSYWERLKLIVKNFFIFAIFYAISFPMVVMVLAVGQKEEKKRKIKKKKVIF